MAVRLHVTLFWCRHHFFCCINQASLVFIGQVTKHATVKIGHFRVLLCLCFKTSLSAKMGGILTFSQKLLSNSLPPGKNVRSNILKFHTPVHDLWSRARTKIQISLLPGQQDNSNVLPPDQSDRSNPHPMPRLPPPPPPQPAWHW